MAGLARNSDRKFIPQPQLPSEPQSQPHQGTFAALARQLPTLTQEELLRATELADRASLDDIRSLIVFGEGAQHSAFESASKVLASLGAVGDLLDTGNNSVKKIREAVQAIAKTVEKHEKRRSPVQEPEEQTANPSQEPRFSPRVVWSAIKSPALGLLHFGKDWLDRQIGSTNRLNDEVRPLLDSVNTAFEEVVTQRGNLLNWGETLGGLGGAMIQNLKGLAVYGVALDRIQARLAAEEEAVRERGPVDFDSTEALESITHARDLTNKRSLAIVETVQSILVTQVSLRRVTQTFNNVASSLGDTAVARGAVLADAAISASLDSIEAGQEVIAFTKTIGTDLARTNSSRMAAIERRQAELDATGVVDPEAIRSQITSLTSWASDRGAKLQQAIATRESSIREVSNALEALRQVMAQGTLEQVASTERVVLPPLPEDL